MTYGFIGCGNMGGALIQAAAKAASGSDILIADISEEKVSALAEKTGAKPSTIEKIAQNADIIFLGVKPQSMPEMLGSIKEILAARKNAGKRFVLVSMAAAVSIERIRKMICENEPLQSIETALENELNLSKEFLDTEIAISYPVIRIMPNLAAAVGEGMMLYCADGATEGEITTFKNLMAPSGKILEINEEQMDAGCAVSGCGPAFAYMFIEAMAKGGEACGLKQEDAILLATQTVLGAAKNMRESEKTPDELVKAVCSPGGTTIEGVKSLSAGALYDEVKKAVEASYNRAKEM